MMHPARLVVFGLLSVALVVGAAVMRRQGGLQGDGEAWLVPIGVLGAVYAVAFVADVLVHAWKGEGQACRACGHVRPMRSFRAAGPCPRCGA